AASSHRNDPNRPHISSVTNHVKEQETNSTRPANPSAKPRQPCLQNFPRFQHLPASPRFRCKLPRRGEGVSTDTRNTPQDTFCCDATFFTHTSVYKRQLNPPSQPEGRSRSPLRKNVSQITSPDFRRFPPLAFCRLADAAEPVSASQSQRQQPQNRRQPDQRLGHIGFGLPQIMHPRRDGGRIGQTMQLPPALPQPTHRGVV
ncbi:hypothetical protein EV658_1211, partial [Phaeovulum veldkampii DSM 11550]